LVDADYINDRGEIACHGYLPNGDTHAVLLIPQGDCDDACEARIADSKINPSTIPVRGMPSNRMPAMRGGLARRFHLPSGEPNK
jgi:hypothetical protein